MRIDLGPNLQLCGQIKSFSGRSPITVVVIWCCTRHSTLGLLDRVKEQSCGGHDITSRSFLAQLPLLWPAGRSWTPTRSHTLVVGNAKVSAETRY